MSYKLPNPANKSLAKSFVSIKTHANSQGQNKINLRQVFKV